MIGIDYILYLFCLLAIVLSVVAQIKVSSTFNKYSRTLTGRGHTAAETARHILNSHGLYNVRIERVGGSLTDHYDPRGEVLRLSDTVYDSPSAAAVGVAAHEAGHAIQHAERYLPIVIRQRLAPVTGFASRFSWFVIMAGILFMALDALLGTYILIAGAGLFAVTTLFQLITLPCEFDASRRALSGLRETGWYSVGELSAAKKVLSAAAMTYVTATLVSVLQLLRILVRIFGQRRR